MTGAFHKLFVLFSQLNSKAIVTPRHSRGFFLCGQSPVLLAAPQGARSFLTLATKLLTPSRKQDKTKIESTFGAEGDRYGRGLRPLPAKALLVSWKLPIFALTPKRKDCG
ncbi:hypothetical protein A7X67_13330 [Clostridium sp. W14A]|nr:hypothetical protein A7X67_13330 [Clostridium sp. W14A]